MSLTVVVQAGQAWLQLVQQEQVGKVAWLPDPPSSESCWS